jgi:hypothetical protein
MTDNITLPRAVVEEVRSAIRGFYNKYSDEAVHEDAGRAIAALDAALAEPDAIARAVEAEREAICPIVYGLCVSDNNAQEIVNAIRARGSK